MTVVAPGREVRLDAGGVSGYAPQRPEQTLLYQLVERYYPAFIVQLAAQGRTLPRYVRREFEDFLKCGRLGCGFLRVRCERCHDEKLVAFSCKRLLPQLRRSVRTADAADQGPVVVGGTSKPGRLRMMGCK